MARNLTLVVDPLPYPAEIMQAEEANISVLIGRNGYTGPLEITIHCPHRYTWVTERIIVPASTANYQVYSFNIVAPLSAYSVAHNPHRLVFNVRPVSGASHVTPPLSNTQISNIPFPIPSPLTPEFSWLQGHVAEVTVRFRNWDYSLFSLTVSGPGNTPFNLRRNGAPVNMTFTVDRGDNFAGNIRVTHTGPAGGGFLLFGTGDARRPYFIIPGGQNTVVVPVSAAWNASFASGLPTAPYGIPGTNVFFTATAVPQPGSELRIAPVVSNGIGIIIQPLSTPAHVLTLTPAHPGSVNAILPNVTRNESLPLLFTINRGGYTGPMVLEVTSDWLNRTWNIPANANSTGIIDITIPANAQLTDNLGLVFSLRPASVLSPVYPANNVPLHLNLVRSLVGFEFRNSNWPHYNSVTRVVNASDMFPQLQALDGMANGGINVITNPPLDPAVRILPAWSFNNTDNPGHRDFDNSSGATNTFRWTITNAQLAGLPDMVVNRSNVVTSGQFTVTNVGIEVKSISLAEMENIELNFLPYMGSPFSDIITNWLEFYYYETEVVVHPTGTSLPDPLMLPVDWSFSPVFNGGPFRVQSASYNYFRWQVTLPTGIQAAGVPTNGLIRVYNPFIQFMGNNSASINGVVHADLGPIDVLHSGPWTNQQSNIVLPGISRDAQGVLNWLHLHNGTNHLDVPVMFGLASGGMAGASPLIIPHDITWTQYAVTTVPTFTTASGAINRFSWTITLHDFIANPIRNISGYVGLINPSIAAVGPQAVPGIAPDVPDSSHANPIAAVNFLNSTSAPHNFVRIDLNVVPDLLPGSDDILGWTVGNQFVDVRVHWTTLAGSTFSAGVGDSNWYTWTRNAMPLWFTYAPAVDFPVTGNAVISNAP